MAALLRQAVEHADNFRPTDKTLWEFRVFNIPFPVGYIRDVFMTAKFNSANFKVDSTNRIVTLAPELGRDRNKVKACDKAFIEFCQQNTGLCPGFAPWLAKSPEKRDWHAIFGLEDFDPTLKDLRIATPARGAFGVATAGVHCNVYQTKVVGGKEVIDCIWVSQRSASATFPNSPDQCFAGAMDPEDNMIPLTAFKREGKEEAGMTLAPDGKTMLYKGKKCGELRGGMQTISIATLKGPIAGVKEDGHIEFALRYAFDVCLVPGFSPNPHDSDVAKFHAIKIKDLAQAFSRPWKYSSGAVMVDWVLRHDLMSVTPAEKQALLKRLHYKIPLKNVQKYLK